MDISREKLEEIYRNNSNEKAAKILKISTTTLNKCVKAAKIPFKGHGGRKKKFKLRII